jgi:DDE superfamily endonuclease
MGPKKIVTLCVVVVLGQQRIPGYFAEHHCKQYTFIGACNINGFIIEACDTVERESGSSDNDPTHGTVNRDHFKLWVEECLLPVLGNYSLSKKRSIVVLDNATIHHVDGVVELIKSTGADVINTAPYCPEYNPIEPMFHQYKAALRRHQDLHWSHAHLLAMKAVSPQNAQNLFRKAKVLGCESMVESETSSEMETLAAALFILMATTTLVLAAVK